MNIQELAKLILNKKQPSQQANPQVNPHLAPMATMSVPPKFMQQSESPVMGLIQKVMYGDPERSKQIEQALGMYKGGQQLNPEQSQLLNDSSMSNAMTPMMSMAVPGGKMAKGKMLDEEFLATKRMVQDTPVNELARQMVKRGTMNPKPDALFDDQVKKAVRQWQVDNQHGFFSDLPDEIMDQIIQSVSRYF